MEGFNTVTEPMRMPPSVLQQLGDPQTSVRAELSSGLMASQPSISPKFLYDALGSKLFEAICETPEYYPTRTEAAIFARHGHEIARAIGPGCTLIDLGAGNCAKAASLFPLLHPSQYVPIDISQEFLQEAATALHRRFPHIEMTPLGQDFSHGLTLPDTVDERRRLFFYPGSSLGNFSPAEALVLLKGLRAQCGCGGGLLLGLDLIKDVELLEAAYDDALGVTAAFNLNVLRHVNRLIDADFDVKQWRHRACFNAREGRMEMHLQACSDLTVRWLGGVCERRFHDGQCIHTENSYKYRQDDAHDLLANAGFQSERVWLDAEGGFAVIHAYAR